MKLIDVDGLKKSKNYIPVVSIEDIFNEPVIDAVPVKHGQWIRMDYDLYGCDQCGTTHSIADNTWGIPHFCLVCEANIWPKPYKWEEDEDE